MELTRIEVNVITGEVREIELTPEEIAELEQRAQQNAETQPATDGDTQ